MNSTSAPTPVTHRINKSEANPTVTNESDDQSPRLLPTSMPHGNTTVTSSPDELFGDIANQRIGAFPSPPQSTSTSSQQNSSSANVNARRRPPSQPSAEDSSSNLSSTKSRGSSSNFFSFLFRGRNSENRNIQNYISNEGSITLNAWQMMSKHANVKVRLKILESLTAITQQRRLQVSTLEGIWIETQDMIENDVLKAPFLNLFYNITCRQIEEIGLALRLTFFETIKHIGLTEITAKWLTALTAHGHNIEPFEMTCAELVTEWLEKVVLDEGNGQRNFVHPLAPEVIRLTASLICQQTQYVDEESLSKIIRCSCKRVVRGPGELLSVCLTLLETVFEHCIISPSELFILVSSLCFVVCVETESEKTWKLLVYLLSSEHSYLVFQLLQQLMRSVVPSVEDERHDVAVQIARGAVYILAQALWGVKRIDALNCAPSVVLPAFEDAMLSDPLVAKQVMHATRRLVVKQGKTLTLFTWVRLNKLLRGAIALCGDDVETAAVIRSELHSILSLIESLVDRGEYNGSADEFFELIEDCVIDRPDSSALRLIDWRIAALTPDKDKWIEQLHRLLTKYLYDGVSLVRREKAIYVMENTLKRNRVLHEAPLLRKVILPICNTVVNERVPTIQYFLIHVLFEVAKTTTINPNGSNDLFMSVLTVVNTTLNGGINLGNDNLEVAAAGINELLDERWTAFDLVMVETIFKIIITHLELHYVKMNSLATGCDVRMRLFESLLLIASHPTNGQLGRVLIRSPTQFEPIYNPRIIRSNGPSNSATKEVFYWTDICKVCTLGLENERHWPALERILEFLSGALEHRSLVYTAGDGAVNELVNAVLGIVPKMDERFPFLSRNKLARYLCPVLGKLLGLGDNTHDSQICRIVVELVRTGCPQAIMSCDAAIQVLPDKMAAFNRSLLENLVGLKASTSLAVPIVELLNDAADVTEFHDFYLTKHFKSVVNVLAPYSNARQYNSFIVTSVYSTAMRWYLCVPLNERAVLAAHMFGSFANANGLLPTATPRATESPEPADFARSLLQNNKQIDSFGQLVAEDADAYPTALIITPAKKRSYVHKKQAAATSSIGSREAHPNTSTDSPPTHDRDFDPSSDGRQPVELPFDEPTPLFSTGDVNVGLDQNDVDEGFNFKGVNELAQQILAQEYTNQQETKQTRSSRETFASQLTAELLESLNYFFRFFRSRLTTNLSTLVSSALYSSIFKDDSIAITPAVDYNLDEMVESQIENWVVDGSVLTMRILVKRDVVPFGLHSRRVATISVDRPATAQSNSSDKTAKASRAAAAAIAAANGRFNRSMSRPKQSTPPAIATPRRQPRISTTSIESDDYRKRHQSAREPSSNSPKKSLQTTNNSIQQATEELTIDTNDYQSPTMPSGRATPNSPDSDEIFERQHPTRAPDLVEDTSVANTKSTHTPEYIQLVIRHVFGRESYMMRSLDHVDFDGASSSHNLLMHLRGNRSAVRLTTRDSDLIRRSLNFLDRMPTTENHRVGVMYVRDNKAQLSDVLSIEYGSQRYAAFIRRFGSIVPVQSNKLNDPSMYTYVFCDLQDHVRFEVATLMPNSLEDPKCEEKRKLLEEVPICVVFNESGNPLFATENPLNHLVRGDQVVFEVMPQDCQSVLINVHARREVACWMAMSRALLPDERAAHVVRKLAIRAQRALYIWHSLTKESADNLPFVSNAVARQRHIHKIRRRGVAEPF
ncbi:hypothetical protein M3Y94_01098900 [Aphelenchoides besseyi]|nr:hypothetical protein M3Y94_01098900 [Aphelenchoides besseyi]KAI6221635.1 Rap-GAP domain-containing protein [Aphelenchoides besseyi]